MPPLHVPGKPTGEEQLGMRGFVTGGPGIGGRLKAEVEDFVVVERQLPRREVPNGRYTAALITLRNWETNRFVRQMSRRLGISSRRVRFAGVKDKRAVTTQLFTLDASEDSVAALRMADVTVEETYTTDRHASLGDLVGNSFQVRVTGLGCDDDEATARAGAVLEAARELGGFPAYYGHQRFGVARPVSHLVGRELVRGDVTAACWTYLVHEGPGEDRAAREARRALASDRDVYASLRSFPDNLGHERNMLDHLLHSPDDHAGALGRLPFNLRLMFVHAYQGLAFNMVLSERLARGMPLDLPVEGDLLVTMDGNGNPVHDRSVPVTSRNVGKARRQVERGRALVSGIVPGTEAPLAGGEMGEVERSVMERLEVEPGDFRITELTELTSPGIRRELLVPRLEPRVDVEGGSASFSFSLPKGCYATAVLREFMKAPLMSY